MLQTNTVTNNAFSTRILNLVSLIVPATFAKSKSRESDSQVIILPRVVI